MKIIELRSENVKRVKAIKIKPKDNVVIISGNNGEGKTSVLDSIWFALQGKASLKETPMPIRKGESKAEVKLVLDDFIVTRNWTSNDKSYLKVTNKEGMSFSSPQELLDSFIGKLTFDPLEFAQMREIDQRNLLLMVADIDIDYWDSGIMEFKEKRRLTGQEVKLLSGEREEITMTDLPKKGILTSELNEELEEALNNNSEYNNMVEELRDHKRHLNNLKEEIKHLEEGIATEEKWVKENKLIDVLEIKERLAKAGNINYQIMARERNSIADKKQKDAQEIYDDYTKKIEKVIQEKETALSTAKMPISGLGISDTGVNYNDIPFGQLSSSEQLKVSMAIAIALNPKLRIIRITDGSLLDDENMKVIRKLADKKDFQVWIERVSDSSGLAFVIEDGEVKNG